VCESVCVCEIESVCETESVCLCAYNSAESSQSTITCFRKGLGNKEPSKRGVRCEEPVGVGLREGLAFRA
jgi:hypothetical protein